jgi:DnaJ-class molecular chaperone
MFVPLSISDEIEVWQTCRACGGAKELIVGDQTAQCSKCGGAGSVPVRVDLRHLANYLGQEMAKIAQLRAGPASLEDYR